MNHFPIDTIASKYGWASYSITQLESGLINCTFKINTPTESFIVQQVNTAIFQDPYAIDFNLIELNNYFLQHANQYLFVAPIACLKGATLHQIDGQFYRVFKYINNTTTLTVVNHANEALEAAKQFGQFTFLLKNMDSTKLKTTIPNFHNLSLRYQQYKLALVNGNKARMIESKALIEAIEQQATIVSTYETFIASNDAKIRVTHHDTKISNVLFNEANKAICVIDLDTVMPGYFLSDVGDMIRTYVSPVSEEDKDLHKIIIRKNILLAIQQGYYTYMEKELTAFEKAHFFFAGEMMIFMQALRFITDYFNNDTYYKTTYPKQNLYRATNQLYLLEQLQKHLSQ